MLRKFLLGAAGACALLGSAGHAAASQLVINTGLSDPADKAAFQALVDDFEKANPGIDVKVNVFGHEEEKIAIRNWLVSDPPDLVYWYPGVRMQSFVKPHLFGEITDVWQQLGLADKVAPGVTEQMTYDGQRWGMPYAYYTWGMYYRKDIFAKYNLPVPQDWKTFLQDCAVLKSHHITPIALGDQEQWPAAGWFDYLDLRLNGFAAHEALMHGQISYDSPSVIKVLQTWADLVKKGYFTDNATSYKWQDAQRFLFNGKAAMFLIGSFMLPDIPKSEASEIGFFDFPVINPQAGPAEDAPIDMFAMPAHAPDPANAKLFMKFMAQPAEQAKFAAAIGELPVVKDAPIAPDPLLQQQAKMLAGVAHFSQFYDRDNDPEMASFGMQQFQRLLYYPKSVDAVAKALAAEELKIYGPPATH